MKTISDEGILERIAKGHKVTDDRGRPITVKKPPPPPVNPSDQVVTKSSDQVVTKSGPVKVQPDVNAESLKVLRSCMLSLAAGKMRTDEILSRLVNIAGTSSRPGWVFTVKRDSNGYISEITARPTTDQEDNS